MGFTAGLYTYPKYNGVEYQDLNTISKTIEYDSNSWAKEHFKSAEEYAQYNNKEYRDVSNSAIDFYKNHLVEDEFGSKHIWKDYAYWCSNGAGEIYDCISSLGISAGEKYDCTRILSKKDIAAFMEFCLDEILRCMPKQCTITHAYKYQRDEDGEIPEDAEITLSKVDGFEVQFIDDDGNTSLKRIDTNPEWECAFGFPTEFYDDWGLNGYVIGLEACSKILAEVDFENSFVVYSGGW